MAGLNNVGWEGGPSLQTGFPDHLEAAVQANMIVEMRADMAVDAAVMKIR